MSNTFLFHFIYVLEIFLHILTERIVSDGYGGKYS